MSLSTSFTFSKVDNEKKEIRSLFPRIDDGYLESLIHDHQHEQNGLQYHSNPKKNANPKIIKEVRRNKLT